MEDITSIISMNLKNIRKERQLTLEAASQLTGVSVSMLGEIERGVTNPTITILWKIADGLKISISDLIKDKTTPVSVVYHHETSLSIDGEGVKIFSLFPFDPDQRTEFYYKEFQAGARYESQGHRKGMKEYILVCEGVMTLQIGEKKYNLARGDAIHFDGDVYHCYQNLKDEPLSAYMILYYGQD